MDSGMVSEVVFLVFAAGILIYGFILYRDLAGVRESNDRARAKLDELLRDFRDQDDAAQTVKPNRIPDGGQRVSDLRQRISKEAESLNENTRQYNARIGQFPEAIVAAIMGLQRRGLFKMPDETSGKTH
jgi:LemA family protein